MKVAALIVAVAVSALCQQIVGARAGLVTFIEGAAALDSKRVSHGRYWQVMDGETLRTTEGQIELQISAGSLLRLARGSEFHMTRGQLDDTEGVLRQGSAILEIVRVVNGSRFRLSVGDVVVEARKPGVYRLDLAPPRLRVYGGEADVVLAGKRVAVKRGQQLDLSAVLTRTDFDRKSTADAFHLWSAQRSFRVYRASAENRRKQDHWQRFSYNQFWNESYAVEMPARR
jgi:hypothetical protein